MSSLPSKAGSSIPVCTACMWMCVCIHPSIYVPIHPSTHPFLLTFLPPSITFQSTWELGVRRVAFGEADPHSQHSTADTFQNAPSFCWATFPPTLRNLHLWPHLLLQPSAPWPTYPSGCPSYLVSPTWLRKGEGFVLSWSIVNFSKTSLNIWKFMVVF